MLLATAPWRQQGLTDEEYSRLRELLSRDPNPTELAVFAVMWSEHCSYKSSRIHLKTRPTRGPGILLGRGENAGVVNVGDGWACAFKIESHNHPSFIEPFQGAATGVGGILRDIFTMGARPLAIMDSLRLGPPQQASNRALLDGIVSGIGHYGNCFGVPNLGGETVFDACYSSNPLVNVFALGIARVGQLFLGSASGVGNPVIYVGAKTGRDGIHGATMASEEFSEASAGKRPNVQVGDPFLEKLLLEACLEAMATGAVVGIQDMGAAGLTSSSCEMGARAGTGLALDLDCVPQRETGMSAYEILLSESQERMLLVAQRGRESEIVAVFAKWGLDAVSVGEVTGDGHLRVSHRGRVVCDIPNAALTAAAPRYDRPRQPPPPAAPSDAPPGLSWSGRDVKSDWLRLLRAPNVCSKRWVWQQYDTMVRTNTLAGPGGDAGVIRIPHTRWALAMALDGNGRYTRLDPRAGARLAVAEAARKVACTGAVPIAATNCLNFGNPEKPEVMWQLAETIAGMGEACRALATPITGGNVSLYNETLGIGIQPTAVVGVVGRMELDEDGQRRPLGARFPAPGLLIALLSGAPPAALPELQQRLGSSEYAAAILGCPWGMPPALDLEAEQRLLSLLHAAWRHHWLASAHQVSTAGLAACLTECCLARRAEEPPGAGCGAAVEVSGPEPVLALFAEPASTVLISCRPQDWERLRAEAERAALRAHRLGTTLPAAAGVQVRWQGQVIAELSREELTAAWEPGLERWLSEEGEP